MNNFFADAFYWIALCHCRDRWHSRVQAFSRTLRDYHLCTTEEVLTEFLSFFSDSSPHTRRQAARFARSVLSDANVMVIPQTHDAFMNGLELYESRLDKHYSLTDCNSMQTMERLGLTDVLTNDHHFTQEGFRILFQCISDFSVPSFQLGVMRVSTPYTVIAICSQGVISFPHFLSTLTSSIKMS